MNKNLLIFFIFMSIISCNKDKTLETRIECNSINPSFINDVMPIIQNNCTSCHTWQTPLLIDYSSICNNAELILNTIKHEPGFSAMPKNTNKLSDSIIRFIDCWIQNGKLNN